MSTEQVGFWMYAIVLEFVGVCVMIALVRKAR
jgi:hypothetical protein